MVQQTNTFVCEECGCTLSLTKEADVYDDPVITPPPGWDVGNGRDLCPECIERQK